MNLQPTIKIDWDKQLDPDRLVFLIEKAFNPNFFNLRIKDFRLYQSGRGGYHVEIDIDPPLPPEDCCFLQLLFMSDPMREIFNWRRIKGDTNNWNVLFDIKNGLKRNRFHKMESMIKRALPHTLFFPREETE